MMKIQLTILLVLAVLSSCEKKDCIDESKISNGPCTREYAPVCGCDSKTYGNACTADNAGVTSYEQGECKGNLGLNVSDSPGVEGVFEYLPPLKGQTSIRNGRFVHVYGLSDGSGQMTGEAGTYKIDGQKVICAFTYSTNAGNVGTSFTWQTKSWSGDTLTYEILNDKDEVSAGGRALRLSR